MKLRTYFLSWYIQLISTRAAALVIKVFNVSEVPGTQPLPVFTKCSIYHFSFPGPSPGFPQTSSHFRNEMPSFLGVRGLVLHWHHSPWPGQRLAILRVNIFHMPWLTPILWLKNWLIPDISVAHLYIDGRGSIDGSEEVENNLTLLDSLSTVWV